MRKYLLLICLLLSGLIAKPQSAYLNVATSFSPMWNGSNFYYQMYFENSEFILHGKNSWNPAIPGVSQPFYARFSAQGDSLGFSQIKDTTTSNFEYWGGYNSTFRYKPNFPFYSSYTYRGNQDAVTAIYKYDTLLNYQLIQTIQDTVGIATSCNFETSDNAILSCGWKMNSSSTTWINIMKTTKSGGMIWQKSIQSTGFAVNLKDGVPLPDSSVVVSGWCSGKPVVVRLDIDGNIKWQKYFNGHSEAWVEPTPDSCLMVAFDSVITTPSSSSVLKLVKLNPLNGAVIWDSVYCFDTIHSGTRAFRVTSKGDCLIAGTQNYNNNFYYLKINTQHNVEFFKYSPQYWIVSLEDIIECGEGLACCGRIKPNTTTPIKSWFFTTDRFGCMTPNCGVGIEEFKEPIHIKELKLSPNPASNDVTITATQSYKEGTLLIYDFGGKTVAAYPWPCGESTLHIPLNNAPRGIYQLILVTNTNNKEVGKLVVGR
jgi:hypothetical protein